MSTTRINRLIYIVVGLVFVIGTADYFGLTMEDGHLKQRIPLTAKVKPEAVVNPSSIPHTTRIETVRLHTYVVNPSAGDNAWLGLARVPALVVVCALLFLALKFAANAAHQRIFEASNVWALRAAALLLILAPFVRLASSRALDHVIGASPIGNLPTIVEFSPGPLVAGLALLLLAEAFAVGRRAQKDTEGLV